MKRAKRSTSSHGRVAEGLTGSPKKHASKSSKASKNVSNGKAADLLATKKRSQKRVPGNIKHNRAEPPFQLYRNASETDVSEGLESIVNLLRGRKILLFWQVLGSRSGMVVMYAVTIHNCLFDFVANVLSFFEMLVLLPVVVGFQTFEVRALASTRRWIMR